MRKLPEEFIQRMRSLLGSEEELQAFLAALDREPEHGIRLNLKKLSQIPEQEGNISYRRLVEEWKLQPLSEAEYLLVNGEKQYREFYLDMEHMASLGIRPGKHPYHEAGLYYLQEPSAMQVVMHLDIRPWDRVADLCAAPGGKSTQAADSLSAGAGGWILSNEYVGQRARILSSNLERMGIRNGIVTSNDTEKLADSFPQYFTRVILDAPCSGEGMFRKDENAVAEWSPEVVEHCAARQREIAGNAVRLLAPGGKLSYSTCTFERAENEEMTAYILSLSPELHLIFEKRVWPHRERGEGHYIAVFQREGLDPVTPPALQGKTAPDADHAAAVAAALKAEVYRQWPEDPEYLQDRTQCREVRKNAVTSIVPVCLPDTAGLRVLRAGVLKETDLGKRREPEHALAHALDLRSREACSSFSLINLPWNAPETESYLRGEQIDVSRYPVQEPEELQGKSSWAIVACEGAALGLGKLVKGQVKNHFPKGLRFYGTMLQS